MNTNRAYRCRGSLRGSVLFSMTPYYLSFQIMSTFVSNAIVRLTSLTVRATLQCMWRIARVARRWFVGTNIGLGIVAALFSVADWFGKLETRLFPSVEINWPIAWLLLSTALLSIAAVITLDSRKIVKLRNMRDEIAELSRQHDGSLQSIRNQPTGELYHEKMTRKRSKELYLRDQTSKVIGFLSKDCGINCPTKVDEMSIFFDELYRKIDYKYSLREIRKFFSGDDK